MFALLQLALHVVAVQGHFESGTQVGVLERLDQIRHGAGDLGPLQGVVVRIGGQVDDGHIEARLNLGGGGDPIHIAFQHDVHQHQIGPESERLMHGFFAGSGHRWYFVSQIAQGALNRQGDQSFVLNDHDVRFRHFILSVADCAVFTQGSRKAIVNPVPPSRCRLRVPRNCLTRVATIVNPSDTDRPGST